MSEHSVNSLLTAVIEPLNVHVKVVAVTHLQQLLLVYWLSLQM